MACAEFVGDELLAYEADDAGGQGGEGEQEVAEVAVWLCEG